jgi:enoyl-CoA hydratase/carnithine racemase
MVQSDPVLIDRRGQIARLLLNNPPVNAVSVAMLEALHQALDPIEQASEIRCVILGGVGEKAFCAGADLREESRLRDPKASAEFRALGRRTVQRIENFPKPIVAAIHGYCIGGGTAIGWACDIRIAADNAVFRAGDAYLGIIPSWGMGLHRLPRLLGRSRALDVLVLGEDFGAQRAYELGLITKVVSRAALMEETERAANRIASASPRAMHAIRLAVNFSLRHDWDEMAAYEEELSRSIFSHPDAAEGMAAMMEKRKPNFRDS